MTRRRNGAAIDTRTWPVLYVDPPWKFDNYGMAKHGAQRAHYNGMTTAELCAMPVARLLPKRALCFLWSTGPKEAEGAHVDVLRAWGFRPTTAAFTWVKVYRACRSCGHGWEEHDQEEHDTPGHCQASIGERRHIGCGCSHFVPKLYFGTGCYTGGGTERVWLGVKGGGFSAARFEKDIRHTVIAPLPTYKGTRKKQHSAKPEEVARRIERMTAGPYLEMFARRARPGWDVWGDQAPDSVPCALDL